MNCEGRKIDLHVHMVGNGSGGTGCRLVPSWWRWPLALLMAKSAGLPLRCLPRGLDRVYADFLLQAIRTSTLDAAVILANDHARDARGQPIERPGSIYVPNDYVLELARKHSEFLAGVSIHPGRPDALDELDKCLEGGAVLMKCLPNVQNIDARSPPYKKFWERMAETGLPLLAHTGGEHTLPVLRREFSDPRRLELPLQIGVTVIAAHCATKSGLTDPQYFPLFVQMLDRHPNLYGDNSAFNVPIRGQVVPECLKPPVVDRVLHGSDFPVPILGHWSWWKGHVDWQSFRRCQRCRNPLERDYQLKRAMGFPEECFRRAGRLLRFRPDTSNEP